MRRVARACVVLIGLLASGCIGAGMGKGVLERGAAGFSIRDGLLLHKARPFTGRSIERFPDGRPRLEERYAAGLKDGVQEAWHPDGSVAARWVYVEGKMQGTQEGWYPNGARRFLSVYRDGLAQGAGREWHPNGRLYREQKYENGREVSQKIWRPNGEIYANYVARDSRLYGLPGGRICDPATDGN